MNILYHIRNKKVGLFVYDIFWIFFTPKMVSVAKSFDASIKISFLFPTADSAPPFSMLGLRDTVFPGLLALHFDVSQGKQNQYFKSAFVGYSVGLILDNKCHELVSSFCALVYCTGCHQIFGCVRRLEWGSKTSKSFVIMNLFYNCF
ncbi:unnamed protein product [Coffea canephora]|uniref:Uncharacterized protein n=1 Tax=Coffea canephora TaxID=49390 RepID=A0A068UQL9_COFCA|nr:unnamed protein product [Coffea canephora]